MKDNLQVPGVDFVFHKADEGQFAGSVGGFCLS
jgi:hypothetical protein